MKIKLLNDDSNQQTMRRKTFKSLGDEISLPVPKTIQEIRKRLKEKIQNGKYKIREQIVSRQYTKIVLENGKIVRKQFTVGEENSLLKKLENTLLTYTNNI